MRIHWFTAVCGGALLAGSRAAVVAQSRQAVASQAQAPVITRALSLPERRLDLPVDVSQRSGTLDAYVQELAKANGMTLNVSPLLRDTRLSVLNGTSTPRKLLGGLEWTVNATWVAPSTTAPYLLRRTKQDDDRTELALAKHRRAGLQKLQDRWNDARKWALMNTDELGQLEKREPGMARVLRHPRGSAMQRLGFSLPQPIYDQLWGAGIVRYPLNKLSPQLQQLVLASSSQEINFPKKELLERGLLKMEIAGTPDRPTVWLSVKLGAKGYDGNLLYAEGWNRQPPSTRRAEAEANPTPVPRDPLFKTKVSIRDPASPHSLSVSVRPRQALPLLPLVEQISRQVKTPMILQCDFRPRPDEPVDHRDPIAYATMNQHWLQGEWWLADEINDQPLARALDLLCADFEYEWTYRNGAILLRHRRSYLPENERVRGKRLRPVFVN